MVRVILKSGREKSVLRRHPWIFSGAVREVKDITASGHTVDVLDSNGHWLGRGAYSPRSQIRVRLWTFDENEDISPSFFKDRIERALRVRRLLDLDETTSAYRLINAESDGLPGCIVDRYGDVLVCQFLSAGADSWKDVIVEQLVSLVSPAGVYERSSSGSRLKEGLQASEGILSGEVAEGFVEIHEGPVRFYVDVRRGHKTGFYLDQRENRAMAALFSKDADVLNVFSYSGGFGLWALHGGASRVTNVEVSADALDLLRKNVVLNGMDAGRVENIAGDASQVLRTFRDSRREFDLIVLDPPKFAESASQVDRAARGYKDINLLAFKLLKPGGTLFTFSCSGHVAASLFQKIVADAALDAGRDVQIVRHLHQASDHPVSLRFPEGSYLKGLICRVF